jgi:DNA-binding protein H-NS
MKKIITLLALLNLLFLITSCEDSDFNCSSDMARYTVKDIYKDFALQSNQIQRGNINESYISNFLNEYVSYEFVRTTAKDEELKICECEAKLMFNLPEDFKNDQLSENNWFYQSMSYSERQMWGAMSIKEELKNGIDIMYNLQKIDNGEIMAQTYELEVLPQIIYMFHEYEQKKKAEQKKEEITEYEEESNEIENYDEQIQVENNDFQYGTINGSNVLMRSSNSTQSDKVGVFKNNGERIQILEKKDSNGNNRAITNKEISINENYVLPKGKAIKIISKNPETASIEFKEENSKVYETEIKLSDFDYLNDFWYKIKSKDGKIGWVYGKFITAE